MKNKFVLVTPDYPPARGGVARYLGNLVLASSGGIRVIVPERHPSEGPGDISHATFVSAGWPSWRPLIRRLRLLKEETVLVSHIFPIGTAAWISRISGGPSYVVLLHGLDVRLAMRNAWKRWLFRWICRTASHVIANSHATAKDAERVLGTMPVVLTPGVEDIDVPSRETARRRLGIAQDAEVVLSVTRLVPRKGIDMALRVMSRIQRKREVEYAVLGQGEDLGRLQNVAEEHRTRVRWIGSADDGTKWDWLAAADVFLLPVRDEGNDVEGFGIVFLEAARAGVPSVAGKSGGAVEAVVHERTGLLINPMDVDALEDGVERLLADADVRREMGKEARRRAETDFRWQDRWDTLARL